MSASKPHLRRSTVPQAKDYDQANSIEILRKENERLKRIVATAIEELEAGNNGAAYKLLRNA